MVLLEMIGEFIRRMTLPLDQFGTAPKKETTTESDPLAKASPTVRSLKKYNEMYFNDFFQLAGYSDEEYREVLTNIYEDIVKDPTMQETKIDDIKRFSDFSRQMLKVLRTFIKDRMKPEDEPNS